MSLDEDNAASLRNKLVSAIREEIGLNEAIATPIAEATVRALRRVAPAQELYIPAESKGARNAAIRAEFNGRNRDEVMKKHGISRRTLYRLVGRDTRREK